MSNKILTTALVASATMLAGFSVQSSGSTAALSTPPSTPKVDMRAPQHAPQSNPAADYIVIEQHDAGRQLSILTRVAIAPRL